MFFRTFPEQSGRTGYGSIGAYARIDIVKQIFRTIATGRQRQDSRREYNKDSYGRKITPVFELLQNFTKFVACFIRTP